MEWKKEMTNLIVDENYPGLKNKSFRHELETNLIFEGNIKIDLPYELFISGSINAGGSIKVRDSINTGGSIKARGFIKALGSIKARGFIESRGFIKALGFIKAGDYIESTKIKSSTFLNITGFVYFCQIWGGYIKLGCETHTKEEWVNFTDNEILKMDGENALKFWKTYKDFILSAPNERYIEEAIELPKGVEPHSYSDYKEMNNV